VRERCLLLEQQLRDAEGERKEVGRELQRLREQVSLLAGQLAVPRTGRAARRGD
jgi:hypothetical protein